MQCYIKYTCQVIYSLFLWLHLNSAQDFMSGCWAAAPHILIRRLSGGLSVCSAAALSEAYSMKLLTPTSWYVKLQARILLKIFITLPNVVAVDLCGLGCTIIISRQLWCNLIPPCVTGEQRAVQQPCALHSQSYFHSECFGLWLLLKLQKGYSTKIYRYIYVFSESETYTFHYSLYIGVINRANKCYLLVSQRNSWIMLNPM